jgi:hypothetical protein
MQHKLIKTDNYLLVVDDSGIKEGDFVLTNLMEIVVFNKPSTPSLCKKIIAHLPINKIIAHLPINAPILEGVPLLPPLEDEIEKLAKEEILYNDQKRAWWKQGYNKAKEKYQFTLEDMRKAIDMARKRDEYLEWEWHSEKIIQSLQQPKYPVAFECEIEVCVFGNHTHYDPKIEDYVKPKTITNPQGQTQLVGTYIYE